MTLGHNGSAQNLASAHNDNGQARPRPPQQVPMAQYQLAVNELLRFHENGLLNSLQRHIKDMKEFALTEATNEFSHLCRIGAVSNVVSHHTSQKFFHVLQQSAPQAFNRSWREYEGLLQKWLISMERLVQFKDAFHRALLISYHGAMNHAAQDFGKWLQHSLNSYLPPPPPPPPPPHPVQAQPQFKNYREHEVADPPIVTPPSALSPAPAGLPVPLFNYEKMAREIQIMIEDLVNGARLARSGKPSTPPLTQIYREARDLYFDDLQRICFLLVNGVQIYNILGKKDFLWFPEEVPGLAKGDSRADMPMPVQLNCSSTLLCTEPGMNLSQSLI
jgi:hypothetical protein